MVYTDRDRGSRGWVFTLSQRSGCWMLVSGHWIFNWDCFHVQRARFLDVAWTGLCWAVLGLTWLMNMSIRNR